MRTSFETLKNLARYSIDHLSEKKLITFPIEKRSDLIEALATEYGVSFATDEDIRDQAIEEVEEKIGVDTQHEDITESEMYNHARKEIIKGFQGEALAGLYMVESLNQVAIRVKNFLLDNQLVEDVFATDEELVEFLVQKIRIFSVYK
jgi:hypothetical protein